MDFEWDFFYKEDDEKKKVDFKVRLRPSFYQKQKKGSDWLISNHITLCINFNEIWF